jgi:hypothetical protein
MTTIEQERLNKLRGYSKAIGGISCCSTCDLIFLFDVIDEAVEQIDSMQEEIDTKSSSENFSKVHERRIQIMSLQDHKVEIDHFLYDINGHGDAMGFPCDCCIHRVKKCTDYPCIQCGHSGINYTPPKEEDLT